MSHGQAGRAEVHVSPRCLPRSQPAPQHSPGDTPLGLKTLHSWNLGLGAIFLAIIDTENLYLGPQSSSQHFKHNNLQEVSSYDPNTMAEGWDPMNKGFESPPKRQGQGDPCGMRLPEKGFAPGGPCRSDININLKFHCSVMRNSTRRKKQPEVSRSLI